MDPYNHSTPISTKLPILDTGKFEQWKFRIQQYLQHEHYALWEVIEFVNSYKAPLEESAKDKGLAGEVSASTKKKGRIMAITTEDMYKRKNDVKARNTLLLALPDEHHLRFSKYDFAKEFSKEILKTFGGNEATKKKKKNQLKQQYGNFKAEGSETLEQTFNRLQAIITKESRQREERESYKKDPKVEEHVPKVMIVIDGIRWDWSYMVKPTPSIDVSKSVSKEQEERWKSNNPSFFEQRGSSAKNKVWVPTVRPKIPIVGLKVPAAKPTVAADKGNKGKAVKASARWI
nr:hypothetical protein [Tanacetum cinerariifolium]